MTQSAQKQTALSVCFAGDSGDGMQLAGDRLANLSAVFGNEVITLADFPAEIRAPAGSISGVSGFQLNIGTEEIFTPGDEVDLLIAMNPAALKANLPKIRRGASILINEDSFTDKNISLAGFGSDPRTNGELESFTIYSLAMAKLTKESLKPLEIPPNQVARSKNFFALGLVCWLTSRPIDTVLAWIKQKFAGKDQLIAANQTALNAGYRTGEASEIFPAPLAIPVREGAKQPGTYRYVTGNTALALGLIAASEKSGRSLFFGGYPITPASDILHNLSKHKNFAVTTFQAEDEMAAIGAALGASFTGSLGVTATSGPGLMLKGEFINLAVITELPLVVIDVMRGGPSTGLPTKTEQADLLAALWGRTGESPLAVLAPKTPSDCFATVYEAAQLATKYLLPVIVLSDGYLAHGSEAWRIPNADSLTPFSFPDTIGEEENFMPYARNQETLARSWVVPGMKGFEHCIGGLEKEDITGKVCYDPANHETMTELRAAKVQRMVTDFPPLEVEGKPDSRLLVLSWGSTYGAARKAVANHGSSAHVHLRHLNPLPIDLEEILNRYPHVLIPENNSAQLAASLTAAFPRRYERLNKIQGLPFKVSEIETRIRKILGELL